MRKRSPKKRPQPEPTAETAPVQTPAPVKTKPTPITVRRVDPLPPEAVKERKKFREDSADIEEGIWRSIYG